MIRTMIITLYVVFSLSACGTYKALTMPVTTITDNQGTADKDDDLIIKIKSRPDAVVSYDIKKNGSKTVKVDNRGKQGWTEKIGDAAIDALRDTDVFVGTGGTSKGSKEE